MIEATKKPSLTPPLEALDSLLNRLSPLDSESIGLAEAPGRVLAQRVSADRPSPACDVSAMDGYAVRLADLPCARLPVAGEVLMGQRPPALPTAAAIRIFTGGAVPHDADAVIRREDVIEKPDHIEFPPSLGVQPGQHIRRQGENAPAGITVLQPGRLIDGPAGAALANFGITRPHVTRRVHVGVIVTGNELLAPDEKPQPWQLRDSNAYALGSLLSPLAWLKMRSIRHAPDEPETLARMLKQTLTKCDAIVLTGGVSMGDHDYVPRAVEDVGGQTIFHKLALRPGKPVLAAVACGNKPILGLPGNPVSVMTTARRLAVPVLRKLAGFATADPPVPVVEVVNPDEKTLSLWWYRPVRLTATGQAELIKTMGSGDLVSAAQSDGFIQCPPDAAGPGPWAFYNWTVGAAS